MARCFLPKPEWDNLTHGLHQVKHAAPGQRRLRTLITTRFVHPLTRRGKLRSRPLELGPSARGESYQSFPCLMEPKLTGGSPFVGACISWSGLAYSLFTPTRGREATEANRRFRGGDEKLEKWRMQRCSCEAAFATCLHRLDSRGQAGAASVWTACRRTCSSTTYSSGGSFTGTTGTTGQLLCWSMLSGHDRPSARAAFSPFSTEQCRPTLNGIVVKPDICAYSA